MAGGGGFSLNIQLIARAAIFTLLLPGVITVVVPYLILEGSGIGFWSRPTIVRIPAALLGMTGAATLLHCIWAFAFYGKGTLAPIDPPGVLVVRGFYKYSRNPMYLAVLSLLTAESLFFGNPVLLLYTAIVFFGFHLFVLLYEEPHLRHQFGAQYLDYCRGVPRWGLTLRPFKNANCGL
jgi:protein-S-isoprenylcysteine O-methyltransferase Ste14